MSRPEVDVYPPLSLCSIFFEIGTLTEPGVLPFALIGSLASPWGKPVSTWPAQGLETQAVTPSFHSSTWDPNPGPHAWAAST